MAADPDSEILIETSQIGAAMEVRAVSASDGLEVVFTAPASASQKDIERLARAKLAYVRARQPSPVAGVQKPDGKGGIIV